MTSDATPPTARPSVPGIAFARYWWIVVVLAVVFAGVGVVAANQRKPVFTAQAQLTVGQTNLETQSLPSYAEGTQNLAAAYARIVESQQVLALVARRTGTPLPVLISSVSATPIPESAVIKLSVEAGSARTAERLASTIARAAIQTVEATGGSQSDMALAAFKKFQEYTYTQARRSLRASQLGSQFSRGVAGVTSSDVIRARALSRQSSLLVEAWGAKYQSLRNTQPQNFRGISLISDPLAATNDRSSYLQRLGFVGFAVGVLLGVGLALLLASRRARALAGT